MNNSEPPRIDHHKVLIVEDELHMRNMLERAVREMEFVSFTAASAEQALILLEEEPIDIVVLDLHLPGMNGMQFFQTLTERHPNIQTIILTGFGDLNAARHAIRLNVVDFLTKPCALSELETALDRALRRRLHRSVPTRHDPVFPVNTDASTTSGPHAQSSALADVERQHILAALQRNNGNRSAAAAELGISVRTLYYRLAEYQKHDQAMEY